MTDENVCGYLSGVRRVDLGPRSKLSLDALSSIRDCRVFSRGGGDACGVLCVVKKEVNKCQFTLQKARSPIMEIKKRQDRSMRVERSCLSVSIRYYMKFKSRIVGADGNGISAIRSHCAAGEAFRLPFLTIFEVKTSVIRGRGDPSPTKNSFTHLFDKS